MSTGSGFAVGAERRLPIEGFRADTQSYRHRDIVPDGECHVMIFPANEIDSGLRACLQINIALNWFKGLKARVLVPWFWELRTRSINPGD